MKSGVNPRLRNASSREVLCCYHSWTFGLSDSSKGTVLQITMSPS